MSIVIRDYKREDIEEIRKLLFDNGFRHLENAGIFMWQFFGYGDPIIKAAIDKSNYKIVGHYGLIPLYFYFDGQIYRGGKIEGSVVHEDYRGRKLDIKHPELMGFRIFQTLVEEMKRNIIKKEFDFVFGFPNKLASKTQLEGFRDFSFEVVNYVKVINYEKLIERKLKIKNLFLIRVVSKILSIFMVRKIPRLKTNYEVESFDVDKHNIEQLFNNTLAKSGLITIARDSKLIDWKYINNPAKKYSLICAKNRKGVLKGILFFSIDKEGNYYVGNISDIICDLYDKDVLDFLLLESLKILSDKKVDLVKFLLGRNKNLQILSKTLKGIGFVKRGSRQIAFLYISEKLMQGKKEIYDINNWYITSLFKQY